MPCTPAETKPGLAVLMSASDTGTRPIPDGTAYWTNENIWIAHPHAPSADEYTAAVGTENTINVRVSNLTGAPIENVNVEAWVCDFTMGMSPATALPNPGAMTGFAPSVPAAGPGGPGVAVVSCMPVWIPAAAQTAINGGHVCIGVNCYGDGDGLALGVNAFNFPCNARQAQRNIMIESVPLAMARRQQNIGFTLPVHNTHPVAMMETVVTLRHTIGANVFHPAMQRAVLASSQGSAVLNFLHAQNALHPALHPLVGPNVSPQVRSAGSIAEMLKQVPAAELPFRASTLNPAARHLLNGGSDSDGEGSRNNGDGSVTHHSSLRLQIPPQGQKTVHLNATLNPQEAVGNVHIFDFSQASSDGAIVGGARILAVITP